MSPLLHRHQAAATRDAALQRRRQVVLASTVGGLAAVGAITGVMAGGASSAANGTSARGSSAAQSGDSQSATSQSSSSQDTLGAPAAAPTAASSGSNGGSVQAITGGSAHR